MADKDLKHNDTKIMHILKSFPTIYEKGNATIPPREKLPNEQLNARMALIPMTTMRTRPSTTFRPNFLTLPTSHFLKFWQFRISLVIRKVILHSL